MIINTIQRAAEKAEKRKAEGHIACFADRLAIDLAELSTFEINSTLRDWVAAADGDPTEFIRMRSLVAQWWLSDATSP